MLRKKHLFYEFCRLYLVVGQWNLLLFSYRGGFYSIKLKDLNKPKYL